MEFPDQLTELIPITEILNYQCKSRESVNSLYSNLPDVLIPILIGKLREQDYCFSQVIRLCIDEETLSNVGICSGYNEVSLSCQNKQYRFYIYSIDLVFLKNGSVKGRHSEALIVDSLFQTIEFFEPNGPVVSWYTIVSSFLENEFSALLPNYKYLSTIEFCPMIGPQAISEEGICGAFSLLFILLRVFNIQHTSGEIMTWVRPTLEFMCAKHT